MIGRGRVVTKQELESRRWKILVRLYLPVHRLDRLRKITAAWEMMDSIRKGLQTDRLIFWKWINYSYTSAVGLCHLGYLVNLRSKQNSTSHFVNE